MGLKEWFSAAACKTKGIIIIAIAIILSEPIAEYTKTVDFEKLNTESYMETVPEDSWKRNKIVSSIINFWFTILSFLKDYLKLFKSKYMAILLLIIIMNILF